MNYIVVLVKDFNRSFFLIDRLIDKFHIRGHIICVYMPGKKEYIMKRLINIILAIWFFTGFVPYTMQMAWSQQDAGLAREVKPIDPPPGFEYDEKTLASEIQAARERLFYRMGTLDALEDGWITVGDFAMRLAPDADLDHVKLGMYVGVEVNDEGKVSKVVPLDPVK